MYEELKIILYPDPRLRKVSKRVEKFDEDVKALAGRMLELMREAKGVGLAAPQVGVNLQLFVMNHTGKDDQPEFDRVYVNPVLTEADGEEEAEEGCLSLPGIHVDVVRAKKLRLDAQDVTGKPVSEVASGYVARIWQHEFDHLQGTMLTDRMGPAAKLQHRKKLKELEEEWEVLHPVKTPAGGKRKVEKKRR